jgi:hypothetical protein
MTEKPLYSKDDGVYCVMGRLKSIHPIIIKTHYCVFTLVSCHAAFKDTGIIVGGFYEDTNRSHLYVDSHYGAGM